MYKINNYLKKYNIKPRGYHKLGKAILVDTSDSKIVVKEKTRENTEIFKYLESRNFDYYPRLINEDDDYELIEYIEDIEMPLEQKMTDMIDLVSMLHSKTTFYKEIDLDEYKGIYEDIMGNIEYLNSHYYDLITIIESKVYMSPKEYLLARNITIIFETLGECYRLTNDWYKLVNEKNKRRYAVVHNNLEVDHFLKDRSSYLISWDKSKIDSPIFDLYKLYKKHGLEYDFENILKRYERTYPLLEEEKKLLYILILLPDKIDFDDNEYKMCEKISDMIDMIYKSRSIVLKNNFENTKAS